MIQDRYSLFPFGTMDHKAAQAYLDKKAEQGWVLDSIFLRWFARYVPAEDRIHFVDLNLYKNPADRYLQLCEDAGWEVVHKTPEILYFRSKTGKHPTPVQSDESMEAEQFWKGYVRKNLLLCLSVFLLFALFCIWIFSRTGGPALSAFLLSNQGLLYGLALVLLAIGLVWQVISLSIRYHHWRKAGSISTKNYRGAFVKGILWALIFLLTLATLPYHLIDEDTAYQRDPDDAAYGPVLDSGDFGLNKEVSPSRRLEARRSLLVDWVEYTEFTDNWEHIFITERYECASEGLARWLLNARKRETYETHDMYHRNLYWEETDVLGFDQCWVSDDGSHLLFHEGKTVVLVGAEGFDLTEHPELVRAQTLRNRS